MKKELRSSLLNWVVYIIILTASTVYVSSIGGAVPYALFYLAVISPVISFALLIICYYRFKYHQSLDTLQVTKGNKVNLTFIAANEDIIPYPKMTLSFHGNFGTFINSKMVYSFPLLPRESRKIVIPVDFNYRGVYQFGAQSVVLRDMLGLFYFTYKKLNDVEVTVYPQLVEIERFKLSNKLISQPETMYLRSAEDVTSLSDVRKYNYGDSLKRIHWKLSARQRELITKLYDSSSQQCLSLLLDLSPCDDKVGGISPLEDRLIEESLAVLHYALMHGMPVRFVYAQGNHIETISAKYKAGFDKIYKFLAPVVFSSAVDVSNVLTNHFSSGQAGGEIVVVTSKITFDLQRAIETASSSSHKVSLIYTPAQADDNTDYPRLFKSIGVDFYNIGLDDSIKTKLEGGL